MGVFMKIKFKKGFMIALVCGLLMTGLVATSLAISDGIQLTVPEKTNMDEQAAVPPVVPTLVSPGESDWEEMSPAILAQKSTLAYLPEKYEGNAKTMVNLIETKPTFPSDQIAYAILTEVKYESEENCTLVTLSQASPAACEAKAIYGNTTVSLENGETAFMKGDLKGAYPHSIALIRGDKIITIATTASKDELIKMAGEVFQTSN
jgi:hypothetical protein